MNADRSVFRFYRDLLKLRRENAAFLDGDLKVISKPEDSCFIYTRTCGDDAWAVVCNFETSQDISLPFACSRPALANLGRETASGTYGPYECSISRITGSHRE